MFQSRRALTLFVLSVLLGACSRPSSIAQSAIVFGAADLIVDNLRALEAGRNDLDSTTAVRIEGGFIKSPIAIPTKGFVPLCECVRQGGGLKWWADSERLIVMRQQDGRLRIFQMALRHAEELAEALCLCPGDRLVAKPYLPLEWAQASWASLLPLGIVSARSSN